MSIKSRKIDIAILKCELLKKQKELFALYLALGNTISEARALIQNK